MRFFHATSLVPAPYGYIAPKVTANSMRPNRPSRLRKSSSSRIRAGFLKFAARPAWMRVSLPVNEIAKVAESFRPIHQWKASSCKPACNSDQASGVTGVQN
jgi:hypothetical protein